MRYVQKSYFIFLWLFFPIIAGIAHAYLKQDDQYMNWLSTSISIYTLFFSVVVHELFHGAAAAYCGDQTASDAGRLTLNPLKHVSLIGTIGVPLLLFLFKAPAVIGWAKPVPFNPINLKVHPRDQVLVASAGPLSNFALSYVFFNLYLVFTVVFNRMYPQTPVTIQFDFFSTLSIPEVSYQAAWFVLFTVVGSGMMINLVLGVFNLIPFPPLDGSWILKAILPKKAALFVGKTQLVGFLLLIIALQFNILQIFFYPAMILLILFQQLAAICLR